MTNMNWPWTTKRQLREQLEEASRRADAWAQANARMEEESRRRGKRILALNDVLEFKRDLAGVTPAEIMDALKMTDPKHPLWLAVQRMMDLQFRREMESALAAGQSAEGRAYNNGRAAAVEDLRTMLLQKWAEARV